jgi:hypothetical protein
MMGCSVHASVPDGYAQRMHKGQSICISLQHIFVIFKVTKKAKKIKKSLLTLTNGLNSYPKQFVRPN